MKNMLIIILYWLPLIASTSKMIPLTLITTTTQEKYPPGTILEVTKSMYVDVVIMFQNDILVVDHVDENDIIIAKYTDEFDDMVQIEKTNFDKIRILNFNIGDKVDHRYPLTGEWTKGEITLLNPLTVNLDHEFLGWEVTVWTNIREMRSEKEEEKIGKKKEEVESLTKESLLEQKKLLLILDLDETMIGAIQSDVKEDQYDFIFEDIYVSFREGWKPFLETISKKYIIGVYTTAVQDYAEAVVNQLDPDRDYITAGVYSSRNGFSWNKKWIQEFHKYMKHRIPDNMIQIVDDKPHVWAKVDQAKVHHISPWNPYKIIENYKYDEYGNVVGLLSVQKKLIEFYETFFDE